VKKASAEEKEGSLPAVKQSKIQGDAGGKRLFWFILYYAILGLAVVIIIYFLTKISVDTYRINI